MDGIRFKCNAGFSMLELLIVMSIATILLTIGIPSFKYVTTSNRLSTEINGLLGDMQYARSQAIKEGLPVTVCSSSDGLNCANTNQWQNGWIVFLDSNNDQARQANETIMRTQAAFNPSGDTLEPYLNAAFNAISFNRQGFASTPGGANITLQLHDSTANTAWTRCLAISPVGMLTTERAGTGNCQ